MNKIKNFNEEAKDQIPDASQIPDVNGLAIGDVIASIRRKKRLDQKDMSDELGISSSYLSQIENNARIPSTRLLKQIADKLDVPISVLLFEALEDSNFTNDEERQLFIKVKPLMDKMLSILLTEDKMQKK